jgi:hypothetical protein
MQPPLLPTETLRRVLRLARVDGLGVLVIAGFFALVSAAAGDYFGAVVGLLVAGAGAVELHGAALLRVGEPRGMSWLVGSQLYLMCAVIAYCGLRLWHVDLTPLRAAVTEEMKESLDLAGYTVDQFLTMVYKLTYTCVAVVTFFYQGGMALYYGRRRAAVTKALDTAVAPPAGDGFL